MGNPCNPKNLQFYGLYLLIKGYLLLNCRLLEPQVGTTVYYGHACLLVLAVGPLWLGLQHVWIRQSG